MAFSPSFCFGGWGANDSTSRRSRRAELVKLEAAVHMHRLNAGKFAEAMEGQIDIPGLALETESASTGAFGCD
jgi:hypothetical protein